MMWKKVVLVATVVIAAILVVITVRPTNIPVSEFREEAHVRLAGSSEIPFFHSFELTGLALSGTWEGPGFAQVLLVGGDKKLIVLDTRSLPEVLEFSGFGSRFDAACLQTCSIPPLQPEHLYVFISGPGFLTIDTYHFAVPLGPSGLATCPNCKKISAPSTPNHTTLLMILLLVISIIGAHSLSHVCKNPQTKRILIVIFLAAFIALGGVFGVSVAAPTAAIAVATKKAASVLAAFGVIVLFVIFGIEMLASKHEQPADWKEDEECQKK